MSSEAGPAEIPAPSPLWRVARRRTSLAYSRIAAEDAMRNAGNRFDVPGAGVLYAAETPEACFVETLARFRPSLRMLADVAMDEDYMNAGAIPSAWRGTDFCFSSTSTRRVCGSSISTTATHCAA